MWALSAATTIPSAAAPTTAVDRHASRILRATAVTLSPPSVQPTLRTSILRRTRGRADIGSLFFSAIQRRGEIVTSNYFRAGSTAPKARPGQTVAVVAPPPLLLAAV